MHSKYFKVFFSALVLVFLIFILKTSGLAVEIRKNLNKDIARPISMVEPSLVQIHVVSAKYRDGREIKRESIGSGTIITKEGYIITNHHVAGHAVHIFCVLENKNKIEAKLIGTDPLSDIAVIKLLNPKSLEFPHAGFGDSDQVKVGDHVLAMGSPVSLSQSVTLGIVSNIGMTIPFFFKKNRLHMMLDGEDVGSYVLWIGHDAAIYHGNSGGPLVSMEGRIIGINEIGIGLGGAIPSNLAKKVARQIIKYGRVKRAWTGWEIQPLPINSANKQGALLSDVAIDSPADTAGFHSGDIILSISSLPLRIRFSEDLPRFRQMEADLVINKKIPVEILRDKKNIRLYITPTLREAAMESTMELKEWGITIRNISSVSARELKRQNRTGVLVTSVRQGGPSGNSLSSLQAGDIITSVNKTGINKVKDLISITRKISGKSTDPVPVLIEFDRKARHFMSVIDIGIHSLHDHGHEVRKAWLPLSTQVITRKMAKFLNKPNLTGVRITQVFNNIGEKTRLKPGDIITKINGDLIKAAYPEDYEVFSSMVRQYEIGTKADLEILRNDKSFHISVRLEPAPSPPREMKQFRDRYFEFSVRDIAFEDKSRKKIPLNQTGVIVNEVKPGSWAALGNLAVDDIIIGINGEKIEDVVGFKNIMKKVKAGKKAFFLFHVQRGVHQIYLELEKGTQPVVAN